MPPDERLVFSVLIRGILVTAAVANLTLSLGEYRRFGDARGLRGFVSGIAFLAATLALTGSSEPIRAAVPALLPLLRLLVIAGIFVFVACLLFSVYTWRSGREPR